MYDWPEIRPATDALWALVAEGLARRGLAAPVRLDRGRTADEIWRDPRLVLSQTCGYPLAIQYRGVLRPVAAPVFGAAGCERGRYRSFIVAAKGSGIRDLAGADGRRLAVNAAHSQSGHNILRYELAAAGLAGLAGLAARAARAGVARVGAVGAGAVGAGRAGGVAAAARGVAAVAGGVGGRAGAGGALGLAGGIAGGRVGRITAGGGALGLAAVCFERSAELEVALADLLELLLGVAGPLVLAAAADGAAVLTAVAGDEVVVVVGGRAGAVLVGALDLDGVGEARRGEGEGREGRGGEEELVKSSHDRLPEWGESRFV
ncbi:MAG: PhnD/SsuA/transferrin family substrate-binding protein [Myxococcales bacterium]|nr:PhnD/SsuA/transferrin family substrate-binding protein [Myxococcales bacterium]